MKVLQRKVKNDIDRFIKNAPAVKNIYLRKKEFNAMKETLPDLVKKSVDNVIHYRFDYNLILHEDEKCST